MKKYLLLIPLLFLCVNTDATVRVSKIKVMESTQDTDIEVGTGATVYTKSIDISGRELISLEVIATDNDGASIDTDIWIEFGNSRPTTEGAADTAYCIPNSNGTVCNGESSDPIDDLLRHIYDLYDKGLNFCRFKILENGDGATFNINLNFKEEY